MARRTRTYGRCWGRTAACAVLSGLGAIGAVGCDGEGGSGAAADPIPQKLSVGQSAAEPSPAEPAEEPAAPAPPQEPAPDPCVEICERTTRLGCKAAPHCMELCAVVAVEPVCAVEMEALTRCALQEPDAHWKCGEQGIAAVAEGYCKQERTAHAKCSEGE